MTKKKKFWLSTLALVLSGVVVGFFFAAFSFQAGKENGGWFNFQWHILFPYDVVFYLLALTCLILLLSVLIGLRRLNEHSREVVDDELYSPAEKAGSKLFMQATLLQSFAILWLFLSATYRFELSETYERIIGILTISSVAFVAVGWLLARKAMKRMNELVPRLAVDLYDTNEFRQYNKILDRMDESEKLQMYKAGFLAMRWMLSLLYVLLFLIFLYSLLVESQIQLILFVGLLAIANQTFYFIAVNKQTKGRKEVNQ